MFLNNFFSKTSKEDFWGDFSFRNPDVARCIKEITGEDFSLLSNLDAKQKVSSLQRLADNNGCSLSEIREVVINSFLDQFGTDKDTINHFVQIISKKIVEEAIRFNIKESNTTSYYIRKWILESL